MNWVLFIFKRGNKHYLVNSGCEDEAWKDLAKRQSMSVERCKNEYQFIDFMHAGSMFKKLG